MEGRDIGTAVLPEAEWKFFDRVLTGTGPEAPANWRPKGWRCPWRKSRPTCAGGMKSTPAPINPLRPAADAVQLDTTALSVEEVVAKITSMVRGETPLSL